MLVLLQKNKDFTPDLDFSARPGTKTYPRWKDALLGCFKRGRYPHLNKSARKCQGLNVYCLDQAKMPSRTLSLVRMAEEGYEVQCAAERLLDAAQSEKRGKPEPGNMTTPMQEEAAALET